MNYLVCSDSFKECMDASKACSIIARGILKADKTATIKQVPLADGGEGTEEVLIAAKGYQEKFINTIDLLGKKIRVKYGYKDNSVIIDCSKVIGLDLIKQSHRNPFKVNSLGLGLVIKELINQGVSEFIIGLGGSATVDGGLGFLIGLGAKIFCNGQVVNLEIASILNIDRIDLTAVFKLTENITFKVASDVDNYYLGEKGAVNVFAKQKGATESQMPLLEANLINIHKIIKRDYDLDINVKKAGAAGGLGGALFLIGADLISGIDMVIKECNLEQLIIESDVVISGEGSVDEQTINGKTISGVAKICQKYNTKLVVLCGQLSDNIDNLYLMGVTAAFSIINKSSTLNENLKNAETNLENSAYNICRLIQ